MPKSTRREFLRASLAGAAGLSLLPSTGCITVGGYPDGVLEVPNQGYPMLVASGSHGQIGYKMCSIFRSRIISYLKNSRDFPLCQEYAQGEGKAKLERMLHHANERFPHLVEELEGMAAGLQAPFMDLFAYNCRSEIGVLSKTPGCSTLALSRDGLTALTHNEDGNDLNVGRMYLVEVHPPSGVSFISFVYPGLLPGNGPGFNSEGIVQTTNYIQPKRVHDGVPRYFIGRANMEAKSLDDAVALSTEGARAFPWHYNFASLKEGRILSVETMPDRHHVKEVKGFYIHTNHLIHGEMTENKEAEQDVQYESSKTRMKVLTRAADEGGAPENVEGMLKMLSLHEGRPYSPCRHPEGDVHGATLGTAVFVAGKMEMTLYHGNPCQGTKKRYTF